MFFLGDSISSLSSGPTFLLGFKEGLLYFFGLRGTIDFLSSVPVDLLKSIGFLYVGFYVADLLIHGFRFFDINYQKYIYASILLFLLAYKVDFVNYAFFVPKDYYHDQSNIYQKIPEDSTVIPFDKDNYIIVTSVDNVPYLVLIFNYLFDSVLPNIKVFFNFIFDLDAYPDTMRDASHFMAENIQDPVLKNKIQLASYIAYDLYKMMMASNVFSNNMTSAQLFTWAAIMSKSSDATNETMVYSEEESQQTVTKEFTTAVKDFISDKYVSFLGGSKTIKSSYIILNNETVKVNNITNAILVTDFFSSVSKDFYRYITNQLSEKAVTTVEKKLSTLNIENKIERDQHIEELIGLAVLLPSVNGVAETINTTSLSSALARAKSAKETYIKTRLNYILMTSIFPYLTKAMILLCLYGCIVILPFVGLPFIGGLVKKVVRFMMILWIASVMYYFLMSLLEFVLKTQFSRVVLIKMLDPKGVVDYETLFAYTNGYTITIMLLFLGLVVLILNFGGHLGRRLGQFVHGMGGNIDPDLMVSGNATYGQLTIGNYSLGNTSRDITNRSNSTKYNMSTQAIEKMAQMLPETLTGKQLNDLQAKGYITKNKNGGYSFTDQGMEWISKSRFASQLQGALEGAFPEKIVIDVTKSMLEEMAKTPEQQKTQVKQDITGAHGGKAATDSTQTPTGAQSTRVEQRTPL